MKIILGFAFISLLISSCASNQTPAAPLSPDLIRSVLSQNLPSFRDCYTTYLNKSEDKYQRGYAKLIFTIGPEGTVTKAKFTELDVYSEELNSCLEDVVLNLNFPKPHGGGFVDVKQPMNFYPKVVTD